MNSDRALLILVRARTPDAVLRALLDAHANNAEAALAAARHGAGMRLSAETRLALRTPDARRVDADLAWLAQPGHRLLAWRDADYPAMLRCAPAPPAVLFLAGDADLLWHPQVAMVGSRHPTPAGRERAHRFARELASGGWAVTSGLAEGIDTAAHLGALAAGRTVAVVATGPDVCYPPGNAALMARIARDGAVISEHPPGTAAIASHFPSRNRIVVGLALGTLVVEAALRSGALISARLAAEAGREVFALPGSVDNPLARGCHRLIRDGAALVESTEEVVAALGPAAADLAQALRGRLQADPATATPPPAAAPPPVGADHNRLWSALGHDPTGMDSLVDRTGLTVAALSSMLVLMELDGRVVADNGRYSRRS